MFLSRLDMTLAVESDVKPQPFLPSTSYALAAIFNCLGVYILGIAKAYTGVIV